MKTEEEKTDRQTVMEILNSYKDNLDAIDSYKFNSVALDIINALQFKEHPEITDEEIYKQFPQNNPTNDAERDLNIRNMFKSIGAKWMRDKLTT